MDVGKKTQVGKKRDMVKAIVVEALTNNYYTIEYATGPKVGEQSDDNGDLVEPLQKKNKVMHETFQSDKNGLRKAKNRHRHQRKLLWPHRSLNLSTICKMHKTNGQSCTGSSKSNLLTMDGAVVRREQKSSPSIGVNKASTAKFGGLNLPTKNQFSNLISYIYNIYVLT